MREVLSSFGGVGILISHDRTLLDALCSQCLFMRPRGATVRPGGYSDEARRPETLERETAGRERDKATRERDRLAVEAQRRRQEAARADAHRSARNVGKHQRCQGEDTSRGPHRPGRQSPRVELPDGGPAQFEPGQGAGGRPCQPRGGAQVMLALGILDRAPAIVVDEPTNHLNLCPAEALGRMLAGFPGALLLVSHDEGLVASATTVRWEIGEAGCGNLRLRVV
mgnify:CR=1 FL=1